MTEQDSGWRRDEAPQHDEQAGASLSPVSPDAFGASSSQRPPSSSQPEDSQRSPYGSADQPPPASSWPPPAGSATTGSAQQVSPGPGYAAQHGYAAPGYPSQGGYGTASQPTLQQPANGTTQADPYQMWSRPGATPVTAPPGGASQPASGGPYGTGSYPATGYPGGTGPTGQPTSGMPSQPGGYPTANYASPGYPYPGNMPGPGGADQPGGPPGGYYPGQTTTAPPRRRGGLIALVVVAALVLTVGSGTIGGLIAHQSNTGSGPQVIRESVPDVSRDSVAGIADKVLPSVVDITTDQGEGSGVIMSTDGSIVTNNHVVEGATGNTVNVTFSSGKTAKATIVGTDPAGDVAVIKAQGVSGLTAATFGDSDGMRVGDTVLAIGSPLGLQGSVSEGIISALHRTISESAENGQSAGRSISDALQTDAAINPGNSGGALVNLNGQVIGINTAIATSGQSSSGNIGVGFAISSNRVKSAADQLSKGGKVSHPFLGVGLTDGQTGGAVIANVVSGGPADKAGLQKGDVVMQADGQNVADSTALINAVQSHKVGDKLQLTVQRNGAQQSVTVTLGETPQ
jgi:putative serine protease PepD